MQPPNIMLMGPGPSNPDPRVLDALREPMVGHLDGYFVELMDHTMESLRTLFRTENLHTIPMSATGSGALEAIMMNLVEPEDEVLVGVIGYFGERLAEMARRAGGRVRVIEAPWGDVIDPERFRAELSAKPARLVAVVHAETSTGARQPIQELGRICRDAGALLAVDCVTSLGGMSVEVDAWGVDAAASCSQKCIGAPPGLGPVTFGPRAIERLGRRRRKPPSWYFDLNLLFEYWHEGGAPKERAFHHTAPVSSIYAFSEALRLILAEGLEARWLRHREAHDHFTGRAAELGLDLFTPEEHLLPMLNVVKIPEGVDDASVRAKLRERGVEIGGGFGPLKGKVWRVGLMGLNADPGRIDRLFSELEQVLGAPAQRGG